jgi:hypothetical protein
MAQCAALIAPYGPIPNQFCLREGASQMAQCAALIAPYAIRAIVDRHAELSSRLRKATPDDYGHKDI